MEDVWRGEAQDLLSQIAQLQEENKQLLTNLSHKDVSFSEEEFQKHEGTGRRPCGGCGGQEKAVPAALTHTGRRGKGHGPRARKGAALWDDRSLCLLPSQSLCLRPIVEPGSQRMKPRGAFGKPLRIPPSPRLFPGPRGDTLDKPHEACSPRGGVGDDSGNERTQGSVPAPRKHQNGDAVEATCRGAS